jgi:hypothetical protein
MLDPFEVCLLVHRNDLVVTTAAVRCTSNSPPPTRQ